MPSLSARQATRIYLVRNLFKCGNAAFDNLVDINQMPSKSPHHRTLPMPLWQLRNILGELRPELAGNRLKGTLSIIVLKHETVRRNQTVGKVLQLTLKRDQRGLGVGLRACTTTVR